MKKKTNVIIGILVGLLIVIGILLIVSLMQGEETKEISYSKVNIDGYEISINDNYMYKYLEKEQHGIFENKDFSASYIYLSNNTYSNLIKETSTYTNMGSKELDSSIEETTFGEYQGFINIKKVNYKDTEKDYNLVIILIKVKEDKTLVFQYETLIDGNENEIFEDIKQSLSEIKEA
jgi:hypothetical protein